MAETTTADPLAHIIEQACASACVPCDACQTKAADGIRAHIAAILDSEEARWAGPITRAEAEPVITTDQNVTDCLDSLRASLLGTTEEAT